MEQRNLILAIVLSLAILLGFQFLIVEPQIRQDAAQKAQQQTGQQQAAPTGDAPTPPAGGVAEVPRPAGTTELPTAVPQAGLDREKALEQSPRVTIESPTLKGSLSLSDGRIDDLTLIRYRESIDEASDQIVLLSPEGSEKPYFAKFGWMDPDTAVPVTPVDAAWQADGDVLAPGRPVTLTWENGQGLHFERRYELDENYMFTVTQRVANNGTAPVSLAPYGLISRTGTPYVLGFYILHEGLLGVFNDALDEQDYDTVKEEGLLQYETTGGWLGITDKYWLVALAPEQEKTVRANFHHAQSGEQDKYLASYNYAGLTLRPGASGESTSRLFAGAKVATLLDDYRDNLGIKLFDRAIDFGWFYWLTKPLFYALDFFAKTIGNFGLAILALTICVKLVFFPLANKSYRSMAKMRKLQPEMLELRERFKEDKQRLNQEMMGLYKREGANPMSGCLPIVVQIPVFFALYKVMFVTIEMRHAPFFGWIQDLSAPDPTSFINAFGLLPFMVPELGPLQIINLGVWPIVMGLTMFAQQQLNPQPPDPVQAKIFLFMPIIFTFLLAQFPAGLVIYWTWNNVLSILQQYVIMRRAGVPIGRKAKQT
jgi:YidC/Oxa1 family membrane protein insertase